jgi:hypothetical protein
MYSIEENSLNTAGQEKAFQQLLFRWLLKSLKVFLQEFSLKQRQRVK